MKRISALLVLMMTLLTLVVGGCGGKGAPSVAIYYFGNENCGACKAMEPVMTALDTRYGDAVQVVSVMVGDDTFKDLAEEWQVKATPTYVMVDSRSEEIGRVIGVSPIEDFDALLAEVGIEPVEAEQAE